MSSLAIVTGSGGLVGSETVELLAANGVNVVGIDNNMRSIFFGKDASTAWRISELTQSVRRYRHVDCDIRDIEALTKLLRDIGRDITLVVHAAAQPSHDWAARDPATDFAVNAQGTLNLLESVRRHAPEAAFAFLSTNKVYGDRPNLLPLQEYATRFDLEPEQRFGAHGIDESMSIDACMHSVFGASKVAADVMVQEYGRYFGMRTACFRAGCLTGSRHSGAHTGRLDPDQCYRLNNIDVVAPDGQPVRWALRLLHGEKLPARVYGPDLMLKLCEAAARQGVSIYLFGGQQDALDQLQAALAARFKSLRLAGSSPSAFSQVTDAANAALIEKIRASGAGILFVGLGCPRQEVWVFENRAALGIPAIAVGAAFDFLSGRKKQAPAWMQDQGLEWLFRLAQEPGRLWRRYIGLNSLYCCLVALQMLGLTGAVRNSHQVKRLNYG